MDPLTWILLTAAAALLVYAAFVAWLVAVGRREEARALAGFIPDSLVLTRRLLGDPRVPRRTKLLLVGLIAYLAMPFDLVPDVIPVAGQLDDVLLVILVLRGVVRASGPDLVREHWPGPCVSLETLLRATGAR